MVPGLISGAVTLSVIIEGLWGIYMGRVNDRVGSRWVITLCSFFLGLGLLLTSITRFSWQLYIFYGILIGLGMGGVFVALVSTVSRWFIKRRGLMTGIVMAGIGAGTLTTAPIANLLISLYGWRLSLIIVGGVVLIVCISAAQFLRRDPSKMGLVPYGQSEDKPTGLLSDSSGLSLKESAGTWQFWVTAVIFAALGYCTFTVNIHIVPHITDLGISAATAAGILGISGGAQSIGGIVLGLAADRIGSRWAIAISLILISAALFWLVSLTSVLAFYLFAVIYSLGIGGGTAMESTLTAELFGIKAHGIILGALEFGFTIGAAIGPFITGYLYDLFSNYQVAFLATAAIGVIGLILTVLLKPVNKPEGKN